jgi:hypothetical protein
MERSRTSSIETFYDVVIFMMAAKWLLIEKSEKRRRGREVPAIARFLIVPNHLHVHCDSYTNSTNARSESRMWLTKVCQPLRQFMGQA